MKIPIEGAIFSIGVLLVPKSSPTVQDWPLPVLCFHQWDTNIRLIIFYIHMAIFPIFCENSDKYSGGRQLNVLNNDVSAVDYVSNGRPGKIWDQVCVR